jgi:hypothetical protein
MFDQMKAAVTISEMARMVGLSRARFYQLIGTAFPWPVYSLSTKRPFFNEDLQKVCLEVRRRNCGVDGRPVLFYARQHEHSLTPRPTPKRKPISKPKAPPPDDGLLDILEGVRSLGLTMTTYAQVEAAVKTAFPNGTREVPKGEVIRAVFLTLARQN